MLCTTKKSEATKLATRWLAHVNGHKSDALIDAEMSALCNKWASGDDLCIGERLALATAEMKTADYNRENRFEPAIITSVIEIEAKYHVLTGDIPEWANCDRKVDQQNLQRSIQYHISHANSLRSTYLGKSNE